MKLNNLTSKQQIIVYNLHTAIKHLDVRYEQKGTEFTIHCDDPYHELKGYSLRLFLQELVNSHGVMMYGCSNLDLLFECCNEHDITLTLHFNSQGNTINAMYQYILKIQRDRTAFKKDKMRLLNRIYDLERTIEDLEYTDDEDLEFFDDDDE